MGKRGVVGSLEHPPLEMETGKLNFLLSFLDQVPLPSAPKSTAMAFLTSTVETLGKRPGGQVAPSGQEGKADFPCNTKQGCFGNKTAKTRPYIHGSETPKS